MFRRMDISPKEVEASEHYLEQDALLSPAPPHRDIHDTTAMLTSLISIGPLPHPASFLLV